MIPAENGSPAGGTATVSTERLRQIALSALFSGAAAIAFAPIFVRWSELGPIATAFYRLLFALPALWLWHRVERHPAKPRRPMERRERILIATAGLCFAGDLAFWHWSIRLTSVANATLLANFAPVFVTLAGYALFGLRFSRSFVAGMVVALVGAVILMGQSVTLSPDHLLGDALGLITAVFYAGYIVAVGRLRATQSTATIMASSGLITCALLFVVTLASGEAMLASTATGWMVLIALALISHAGGQSLIAYALAHLPAAFSSVSLLLQPAIAAVLAWIFFGEALGPWQLLGMLLILAGIVFARRGSVPPRATPVRAGGIT
jgi:drug/metabolite transporter (DMT)-like permease